MRSRASCRGRGAATRAAAIVLCVAALAPARAAGDDPGSRLKAAWPRAEDKEREELLQALVASPSPDAFASAQETARVALGLLSTTTSLKRAIDGRTSDPIPLGGGGAGAKDPLASSRAESKDLEGQIARQSGWLSRLAGAAGAVLDALADADFLKAASQALRDIPREDRAGFPGWVAEAVGAAKKERTPPLLLDLAAESLKDQRKAVADRAEPARKLEEVNKKIADATAEYLKARYAQGDYSGEVPEALLGTFPAQKRALDREVTRIQRQVEGADQERRAAGDALSHWILTAEPPAASKGMDLVERRLLADADVDVRGLGLSVVAPIPSPRAFRHLVAAAAQADPRAAVDGLAALAERDEPEALPILIGRLSDARWRVRAAAAESLGRSGRAAAVKPLVEAFVSAKGRDLDDLRLALVALTGKTFPAAAGPWASWWDAEGKTFRGSRDGRPAGAAPGSPGRVPGGLESFPDEGGVNFYGIQTHSTRVLLVLDVSGSMNFPGSETDEAKKKIDVLREEVKKAITGLPDGAVFGLITFSTTVATWKKDPQVRGSKTLVDAVEWFEKTQALGSTNIHDALEQAFKLMGMGLAKDKSSEPVYDTVLFMTDGKPTSGKVTDPKLILGEVRRWNDGRKVRIHVVGVGGHGKSRGGAAADDLDAQFLKDLASQNGGQCVIR